MSCRILSKVIWVKDFSLFSHFFHFLHSSEGSLNQHLKLKHPDLYVFIPLWVKNPFFRQFPLAKMPKPNLTKTLKKRTKESPPLRRMKKKNPSRRKNSLYRSNLIQKKKMKIKKILLGKRARPKSLIIIPILSNLLFSLYFTPFSSQTPFSLLFSFSLLSYCCWVHPAWQLPICSEHWRELESTFA